MPAFRPKGTYAPHVSRSQTTWSLQLSRTAFQVKFTLQRVGHHLRAMLPTLAGGLQWWWAQKGIDPQFFRFLTATSIFNFGISIFFLLYNLLLLHRGFQEDFLGRLSSAMSIGSIAGTLPAAFVLNRLGVRTTLVLTLSTFSAVCAVRTIARRLYSSLDRQSLEDSCSPFTQCRSHRQSLNLQRSARDLLDSACSSRSELESVFLQVSQADGYRRSWKAHKARAARRSTARYFWCAGCGARSIASTETALPRQSGI